MATPPQQQRKAPSGPGKPQIRTAPARSTGERLNVVWKISQAEAAPARMPPKWMNKWGAVQNVSRPMLSCQEMSQTPPNEAEVTASAHAQMCQGTVTSASFGGVWDISWHESI